MPGEWLCGDGVGPGGGWRYSVERPVIGSERFAGAVADQHVIPVLAVKGRGGGSGRGPKLTLTQTMGAPASGGMDALLERGTLEGLAANDDGDELRNRRLELRLGYGFSALADRFTSTPELGLGLSNGHREYTLGWRLNLAQGGPTALDLKLEATRREAVNDNTDPEHSVGFKFTARW